MFLLVVYSKMQEKEYELNKELLSKTEPELKDLEYFQLACIAKGESMLKR